MFIVIYIDTSDQNEPRPSLLSESEVRNLDFHPKFFYFFAEAGPIS